MLRSDIRGPGMCRRIFLLPLDPVRNRHSASSKLLKTLRFRVSCTFDPVILNRGYPQQIRLSPFSAKELGGILVLLV